MPQVVQRQGAAGAEIWEDFTHISWKVHGFPVFPCIQWELQQL